MLPAQHQTADKLADWLVNIFERFAAKKAHIYFSKTKSELKQMSEYNR